MAKVLVVGGGFAGVVAAESLARDLDIEHEVTLVSRSRQFLFYPDLVRFAFRAMYVERTHLRSARGDAQSGREFCPG